MQATFKQSAAQDQWLLWAIVCSVLLHLAVVLIVPNFNIEAPQEIIHELKIELMQPKQAQAEPEIAQESPAAAEPAPLKPEPIKKPKPEPIKKQAEPVKELTPVEISQEIAAPSPPPEVMQVAPSADVKPTVTAPISPPPPSLSRPADPLAHQTAILKPHATLIVIMYPESLDATSAIPKLLKHEVSRVM